MIPATLQRKSGFFIGVACPGCGGELKLEDNFFVLTCPHCESVLRIRMPDQPAAYLVRAAKSVHEIRFLVDHYCRDNSLPLPSSHLFTKPLYYPYWKVDAVALKVRIATYSVSAETDEGEAEAPDVEREHRFTNLTPFSSTVAAGRRADDIPYSLGARAEYIRMVPFVRDDVASDSDVIPVTVPFVAAARDAGRLLSGVTAIDSALDRRNQTRLYRPEGTVIYFPYVISESVANGTCRRFVSDGVTGKVVGCSVLSSPIAEPTQQVEEMAFGSLSVSLHRCPNCGVDLPTTRSCVYGCHNCSHIAMLVENPLLSSKITVSHFASAKDEKLVPFWVVRVVSSDQPRMKRLMGGITDVESILIPAMKIKNFEAMFRLCCRMTTASPKFAWQPLEQLDDRFAPVTMAPAEALRMVEVIAGREEREHGAESESAIPLQPVEISLQYAPFRPEGYFYVDTVLGAVTFERALMDTPEKPRSATVAARPVSDLDTHDIF